MRFIIVSLLLVVGFGARAQTDTTTVSLELGDSLYFGTCSEGSFSYIDLYVKTRFELDSISYDTINGWDFYNRFFNTGDFDVSRMPCSYSGQYGIVKHMMSVQDPEGNWRNVVVVMIRDGSSVGYIVEEAFINEEVIYVPKKSPSD